MIDAYRRNCEGKIIGHATARENLFHDSINLTIEPVQSRHELLMMALNVGDARKMSLCYLHKLL
jgi:hypothetical protein